MDGFANSLQVDYRQLITDAKRSEGFSSQISGFFSGPDNPAVKEAAERAILKVRSFIGPQVLHRIRESQDILRPFLIACETKNTKLIITSLGAIQKLLANDAVSPGKVEVILSALLQVERLNDEGVQLKVLQTALTLLQSNMDIEKEVDVGATLGICFRLLSSRGTHSVLSTAGATVRQGVAVVFERLEAQCRELDSSLSNNSCVRSESTDTGRHLLEDLCDLACGGSAKWLKVSHLPRGFVLDLLDLVLTNHSQTFQTLPELQALLQNRVCPYLSERLTDAFQMESTQAVDSAEIKQLLRLVTTLLQSLHTAIPQSCASLLYTVLKGASTSAALPQRVQALKVFQALCGNAKLVIFLFETHDSKGNSLEQFIVKDMVECFVETSLSYVKLVEHEDHTLNYLANLFASKVGVHGDFSHDSTFSVSMSTAEEAGGVLAMLALDCILAFTSALDILSDQVILPSFAEKDVSGIPTGQEEVTLLHRAELFAQLVDANWKPLLSVLYDILSRSEGEAIVLELVKGYQRMIQTCGAIGASGFLVSEALRDRNIKARDGFLSSLCEFTLSTDVWMPATSKAVPDTVAASNAITSPTSLKETIAGRFGRSTSGSVLSSGSGREAPIVDADARILTPKNVQCMRALFNCAHRLCSSLGTSWAIVLSNLVSLDRILQSPHTTTQEISTSTDANLTRLSADLMILQAAANQLFESTCNLSTEAVLSMMSSLRDISTRSLSTLALRPSHVRLFALERLVEILLANTHRIQDLWGIFLTHILEVVNTAKDPNRNMPVQVRAAGMESLDRAMIGIMGSTKPLSRVVSPNKELLVKELDSGTQQNTAAIERMVLLPLEEVFKQAREVDVRLGVLRIVMHCIQQHGDCITIGWETLLRLLREVPCRDEADALALAFQSVQLMCSDYLPSLPNSLQASCIQVAAMYASQVTDVNISLTAIGLLWNTADLFAMRLDTSEDTKDDAALEEVNGGMSKLDRHHEELLQCLFNSLHKVAADSRPEVRNSAVRTLFAVIATTGGRLQAQTWEACLWDLLFPLLDETFNMAATSSRDEAEAAELGKHRGQSVKMLVHHSRNSAQKQWDETLVLVLAGMGRLLRAYLPILANLPRMEEGWQDIMQMVESTLVSGRKELALAAINTVLAVLNSQAACDALSPKMWKQAVGVFTSGAKVAATQNQLIPLSARTELVKALGTLFQFGPSRFDQEDARILLKWMVIMLRSPHAPEDGKLGPGVLPPMQKVALRVVEEVAPQLGPHYPKLYSMLIDQLIRMLPGNPCNPWCILSKEEHELLMQEAQMDQDSAVTPILQQRVTGLLVALYKQHAPWQVRASRFVPLVTALGNCMLARWQPISEAAHTCKEGLLWRSSANALMAVINAGLPAINIAFVNVDTSDPPNEVWSAIELAFGGFFLGPAFIDSTTSNPQGKETDWPEGRAAEGYRDSSGDPIESDDHLSRAEQLSQDLELEASVLDTLTDGVLTGALHAPESSKRRLIQLVELGVMRDSNRSHCAVSDAGSEMHCASEASSGFPHLCLRKLFVLCSRGIEAQGAHGTMLEVACLTLPVLISCCSTILLEYVEDESALAPDQSFPRWRHELVLCVLEVIASLKVAPSVVDYAVGENQRLAPLLGACRKSKSSAQESTHLLLLYPALIKAISVRDVRIRDNLIRVLNVIGTELGMGEAPVTL